LVARGHCTLPPGPARRKPDSARAAAACAFLAAGRYPKLAGEDASAAFLGPRKPICPQLPTRRLPMHFPMRALSRTRRNQNAPMGSAAAVLQQRRFFFLKAFLICILCSPAAPPTWREQTIPTTPGPQGLTGDQGRSDAESVFNRL
jgi:hypothetical protein